MTPRRRLRILMIAEPYRPVIGGLELHVELLSRELVRRGHHVAVATMSGGNRSSFELHEGVAIYRLAGWSRALAPFYQHPARRFHPTVPDPGMRAALREVLAKERPDVVHAHSWMLYSFLPLAARSTARLVVTLHDYGLICPKKTFLRDDRECSGPAYAKCLACASAEYGTLKSLGLVTGLGVSRHLHRRVDHFLAVSEDVARSTERHAKGLRAPITVVPSFIADDVREKCRRATRPGFLPAGDYIVFVGALGRHKGLDVLLEAYSRLSAPVELVVIGTPRADTPRRFPPGVTVLHDVPHDDVIAACANSVLAVVPSRTEAMGMAPLEAMSCGRAVVASRVGGLADVVLDGQTGLLVPPGDPGSLAQALARLLRDPAERARMGEAGRRRAEGFTVSAIAPRVEGVYREVLSGRARGRGGNGRARPPASRAPARRHGSIRESSV